MAKATKRDGELLVEIERLRTNEFYEKAFTWYFKEFLLKKIKTYQQFRKEYPPGSDGAIYTARIGGFWETVGSIAKHGLINHELLFDRYLVYPYWDQLRTGVEHDRKENKNPSIAENFEWLARKNKEWLQAHIAQLKKKAK